MAKKFEVGRSYEALDGGFDPIKILRRTDKTIWVDNGCNRWMMRIKHEKNGDEYAVDSCSPRAWREAFTYKAAWPVKETEETDEN